MIGSFYRFEKFENSKTRKFENSKSRRFEKSKIRKNRENRISVLRSSNIIDLRFILLGVGMHKCLSVGFLFYFK